MAPPTDADPNSEELPAESDGSGGEVDQDAMAAEWGAMADDPDEGEETQDSTRVLNQDEIDSLLGFDEAEEAGGNLAGIQSIINSSLISYERLPMLEVVFDRLVRLMSTSLRNFTSDNVEVSLDSVESIRFGDYLNGLPLPAMLSVIKAEQWDNYAMVTIDSALIYSVVDVLLGGRRGTAAMRIEGRPYTTIEKSLVERLIFVFLNDLAGAFEPLSHVDFKFDRLETNPRFATISRPSNAAILARLRIDMEDRGGRLELIIPYATLEPIREILLQMFMGEKFGRDSIWETHLATELWGTKMSLDAIMDEKLMSLSEIFDLKVGSQIFFNASPESLVELRCEGVPLFQAHMGRRGSRIAARIEKRAKRVKRKE